MQAPLLFGVDPDETWRYIPAVVRKAGATAPAFVLKAPPLALATKKRELEQRRFLRINEIAPDVATVLISLEKNGKILDDATEEQKVEFIEAGRAWDAAFREASAEIAEEMGAIDEKILQSCVAGWDSLPSASGRMLDFDALKGRILEVVRDPDLRAELVTASCAGAGVSREDAEGLPSSQA